MLSPWSGKEAERLMILSKRICGRRAEKVCFGCGNIRPAGTCKIKICDARNRYCRIFREQGKNVLLLMDSITRFAMAQREVGMSVGEPPVSRGYTPSVFSLLPKLLERSGNSDKGSVTALYTVLVEGDDLNEPITDAVRGILDGHIVLSRDLANRNHYPAIDILTSVSRLMPDIVSKQHFETAGFIKSMMAVYKDAEDIINIGAYKKGSNSEIDRAIALNKDIKRFLHQGMNESVSFQDTIRQMTEIKDGDSDSYEEV
jgi:flagellum-specific ATP synthase